MSSGEKASKRIGNQTIAKVTLKPWEKLFLLLSVFVISATVLMFEIILTRIFSIMLSYHYVFMAVSLAIFGMGLGAFFIFLSAKQANRIRSNSLNIFIILSFFYSLSLLVSVVLLMYLPAVNLLIYFGIPVIPFIFAGAILSLVFDKFLIHGGAIYFADLAGASLGCLLVIITLQFWGAMNAVLLLAVASSLSVIFFSIIFHKKRWVIISIATLLVTSLVLFYNLNYSILDRAILQKGYTIYGPTKIMFEALQEGGKVVYSAWSAFSKTDVLSNPDKYPEEKHIFTDGGAATNMVKFSGDLEDVAWLKRKVSFFPFWFWENRKVLIIGPGGGQDVLMAMLGGAKEITAVEINPGIIEAVKQFSSFNGELYNYKNVKLIIEEGRSFVKRGQEKYDVIYMSMIYTDAAEVKGYSLVENYTFTKQAFKEYLRHLNRNGRLVFMFHDIADLSKAFITAIRVLQDEGKSKDEALKYVLAVNSSFHGHQSIHMPMLVIKQSPFSQDEAEKIIRTALYFGFQPIFIPYVYETEGIYSKLVNPAMSLTRYISKFPINVKPATDDNPFFYNMRKGVQPHLKNLLFISLVLIAVFLVPYFYHNYMRKKPQQSKVSFYFSYYFTSLGIGFMLIEVPLLQRFILFLGYPVLTFSVTLFSLLFFAGLGSLVSTRIKAPMLSSVISYIVLSIAVLVLIYILALSYIFDSFLSYSVLVRSLVAMVVLAPLGFALGMPFPVGIESLKKMLSLEVPWMWGINAVSSVIGSVLALILAMQFGFNFTLAVGGFIYLMLFFIPKPAGLKLMDKKA